MLTTVPGLLLLGSCNSTEQVKLTQAEAVVACAVRAALQLGVKNPDDEMSFADEKEAEIDFRLVSTGQFVTKVPKLLLKGREHAVEVHCTGDFNRRTITSLQIDGTISRPAKAEDWIF